jgi:hypothetical protein
MELPHAGQILTTRKTIVNFMNDIKLPVTNNTIHLLTYGLKTKDDYLRLYATCARLYYLSKLVCRGKDGICKLNQEQYRKKLFDGFVETVDEVRHIMDRQKRDPKQEMPMRNARMVFKNLQILETLWCRGISCLWEQIYIPELAYFLEYVLRNGEVIPIPQYDNEWSLFPANYENFEYTKDIAGYFDETMEGLF